MTCMIISFAIQKQNQTICYTKAMDLDTEKCKENVYSIHTHKNVMS